MEETASDGFLGLISKLHTPALYADNDMQI